MDPQSNAGEERLVEARLQAVLASAQSELSQEQITQIRKRIGDTLKQSSAMRALSLANADEPEIVFSPYRGDA